MVALCLGDDDLVAKEASINDSTLMAVLWSYKLMWPLSSSPHECAVVIGDELEHAGRFPCSEDFSFSLVGINCWTCSGVKVRMVCFLRIQGLSLF